MPDYGKPLEFGVFPEPLADPPERVERLVRAAERSGLDLMGIQDHPYQRRFYDTWTLISYLAAKTERVRFFPDVANLPLRPPAMLAKAAASLDVLTRGRVEIGVGAGAHDSAPSRGRRSHPKKVGYAGWTVGRIRRGRTTNRRVPSRIVG